MADKNKTKNKSVFDSFIRKYQLSKTLRFELKPVGKTEEFLKKNKVFEKDKTIDDSYNQAKFYFNTLHQRFIDAALAPDKVKTIPLEKFASFLKKKNADLLVKRKQLNEVRKNKDSKRTKDLQKGINNIEQEILNEKKGLYNAIRVLFDKEAEVWKKKYQEEILETGEKIKFSKSDVKQKCIKFLTTAGILQVLKYEFPESKEAEFQKMGWPSLYVEEQENPRRKRYIFHSFEKFTGYLSKFQQTRNNLYADDGTSTAVATRIVSNFETFLANARVFNEKYRTNHKEIGFNDTNVFTINHYRTCLLQKGIEALDQEQNSDISYNKIIGRINQQIKEYRDKAASEARQKNKSFNKSNYPLLKTLDKQILGKVEKEKQFIEETGDREKNNRIFLKKFKEFVDINERRLLRAKKFMTRFFGDEFAAAYNSVYVKNATINTISSNTISRRWFAEGCGRDFELLLPQKSKKKDQRAEPKVKQFVTLADIKNAVKQLEGEPFRQAYHEGNIVNVGQELWEQFLMIWKHEFDSLFSGIERKDGSVALIGYDESLRKAKGLESFSHTKEKIAIVKNYADASLHIFQLMKYLAIDEYDKSKITGQLDTNFYAELDEYAKDFEFIKYYNAFRNFITKKPFNENKIKLNFEKTPPILKGFSKQYHSYLLKKNNNGKDEFYLAILKSGEIDERLEIKNRSDYLYFPATQLKFQNLVNQAFEPRFGYVYSEQTNEQKAISDAQTFIRERHLKRYPGLNKLVKRRFSSKLEFTKKVNQVCVEIYSKNSFIHLDKSQIEAKHENGELYLFKIINRDWAEHKRKNSKKNIHTLYFEHLFKTDNLKNPILKISGGSEMFFREETKEIREKRESIITKEKEQNITKFLKDKFDVEKYVYDRYAERKCFLHLSTVMNYQEKKPPQDRNKLSGFAGAYNKSIRQELAKFVRQGRMNIIGIDRGEKHLVYYSVVNQRGEILDQGSFNKINGVDYYQKLVEREKERLINRQSWEPIARIKDLKRGYVSQVVRKIADLVIKYNAIVVMEDLNMRFKQIRGGIERSVYQQLEKQLIDKFGYLIFKDRNPQEIGGVLKGYQLSAPFVSFEKMGKQTGIIFYTQADYTSITDPLTGFRKNIYISNSDSQEKIKDAIQNKFEAIGWDNKEKSYYFTYDPISFVDERNKNNTYSKEWTVYARVPRIRREKGIDGYWKYESIDVNGKLEELFRVWGFENPKADDIKEEIVCKEADGKLRGKKKFDGKEKNFYESFIYLFNVILLLRNSFSLQIKMKEGKLESIQEGIDFIASPVKPFFATAGLQGSKALSKANFAGFKKRISTKERKRISDEFNGDANGAYNIARKGILILNAIKNKPDNPDLYISKMEWDKFVQS